MFNKAISNVYIDISMSSKYCDLDRFTRMVYQHGADRILFATDCPWSTAEDEMRLLNQVALSMKEKAQICYGNAQHILRLD